MIVKLVKSILDIKFIRFGISAFMGLLFKLIMSFVLKLFLPDVFFINYFIIHVLVVIVVFFCHSFFTFNKKITFPLFIDYIKSVMLVKLVDYLIAVTLVYTSLKNQQLVIILTAGTVYFLNYIVVNMFVFKEKLFNREKISKDLEKPPVKNSEIKEVNIPD